MEAFIVVATQAVVFALLGAYVAHQKRRPTGEGLLLGFMFSVLVAALLPTQTPADVERRLVKQAQRWAAFREWQGNPY